MYSENRGKYRKTWGDRTGCLLNKLSSADFVLIFPPVNLAPTLHSRRVTFLHLQKINQNLSKPVVIKM